MPKYTKYLEFSQKERTAIRERDNYRCIFCQIGYEMPPTAVPEMDITDIMHYIPRSSMGLTWHQTERSSRMPVPPSYDGQRQQWKQKRDARHVQSISG